MTTPKSKSFIVSDWGKDPFAGDDLGFEFEKGGVDKRLVVALDDGSVRAHIFAHDTNP